MTFSSVEKLSIHLFLFHVAGFGETGDQQEAWRGLLLYHCHNCCFDRHHPGLSDEVIILSGCPLAISKTVMQVVFGNSKKTIQTRCLEVLLPILSI